MSASRSLLRHIDQDLIACIKNKVAKPVEPAKRVKPVRRAKSYRAARRNAARDGVWKGRARIDIGAVYVKPSKAYPRQSKRECERRVRQMGGAA